METIESIRTAYAELKNEQPQIRIREAANQLNVTEVELLVLQVGETVTPLKNEFDKLLAEIEPLGKVMALSRNNEVVHERKGIYQNFSTTPHAWLFVGKDIDLRIFPSCWKYAFAVKEGNERFSFQFFANDGTAVHKIYMENSSDLNKFHEIVGKFKDDSFSKIEQINPTIELEPTEIEDGSIDVTSFKAGWEALEDTHDFFGLVRKHKLTRTQALRLAPSEYFAKKMSNDTLRKVLNLASETQTSIMVFVGNAGMIQIHTGIVKNIVDHGPWINVLDPDFNLHVKENAIEQSWIVRKPTKDGIVTSLELFNKKGELICTLYGERKPGIPELESWREIISKVN